MSFESEEKDARGRRLVYPVLASALLAAVIAGCFAWNVWFQATASSTAFAEFYELVRELSLDAA